MKITRNPNDVYQNKVNRWKANLLCDTCPCCGENRKNYQVMLTGERGGISHIPGAHGYWKGIFRQKYYNVDSYTCYTCGAKWESEPYEVLT